MKQRRMPPPGPSNRIITGPTIGKPEYIAFNIFLAVMLLLLIGVALGIVR